MGELEDGEAEGVHWGAGFDVAGLADCFGGHHALVKGGVVARPAALDVFRAVYANRMLRVRRPLGPEGLCDKSAGMPAKTS